MASEANQSAGALRDDVSCILERMSSKSQVLRLTLDGTERTDSGARPKLGASTTSEASEKARPASVFDQIRAELLALDSQLEDPGDQEDHPGNVCRQALQWSMDVSALLHGAAGSMPHGLTRSMEEEFRRNEKGKWWEYYNYVVYQPAKEKTYDT